MPKSVTNKAHAKRGSPLASFLQKMAPFLFAKRKAAKKVVSVKLAKGGKQKGKTNKKKHHKKRTPKSNLPQPARLPTTTIEATKRAGSGVQSKKEEPVTMSTSVQMQAKKEGSWFSFKKKSAMLASPAHEEIEKPEAKQEEPVQAQALAHKEEPAKSVAAKAEGNSLMGRWQKKLKGAFILKEDEPANNANAEELTKQLLSEDDMFLSKVKGVRKTENKKGKTNSWSILADRFFGRAPSVKKARAPKDEKHLTKEDLSKDSFLQRVQQKNVNAVVGTAVDSDDQTQSVEKLAAKEKAQRNSKADSLEDLVTGAQVPESRLSARASKKEEKAVTLSAADLRKESQEAKEAALRLEKEVKEIKEEMRTAQKEREKSGSNLDVAKIAKKPELEAKAPKKKNQVYKRRSGMHRFLASISHFGMGKERIRFIENLATMLNAGLPLVDSLKTLMLETRSKPMRKLVQRVLDSVENGSPLWRAMQDESFFTLHALALIRIGEEAGDLAQNIVYLSQQEEKDHALKSKVQMAMIYPTIVLTIMFIIVMGLGMFVLPNLIGVLYSLNVPLPLVTRIVIMFTNAFSNYGAIAVPATIAGFIGMIILAKFTPARVVFQWVMFHIPGIGRLAREATIARFGVILGGLLRAGVPIVEAMQSLVDVTPIVSYRNLYARLLDHITVGDSFGKSFGAIRGSERLLSPSVQQLIITGEKSGSLSDIMLKIADIYDKKASETAQKLPVILEPMLLLFIGGLVGTIAFAIIVPIYSIVGNVGRA